MDNEVVIKVDKVSKNFKLPHEKTNSIKSLFVGLNKKKVKGYETQHALKDISFEIKKGEFFGIVGRNGSGKSTLLKILAGIYQPTSGKVETKGKIVPFIELGVGFNPELTGRENVYLNGALLGFTRKEIDGMYEDIVAFAELERFMDQKLKNYSSGMQVRLAFSVATRAKADILIVDEVLAVGDADFQKKCYDYFKAFKRKKTTVVFVSHDMSAVQQYCERAALIEKSKVVAIDDASKIAVMYSKLFMHEGEANAHSKKHQGLSASGEERWGDGWAEWTGIDLVKGKQNNGEDETFTIRARGIAHQDIDFPIFGFSIKNQEFMQLLGTNTVRRGEKVTPLQKGQTFSVEWVVPNILNSGKHYVDCTIAHDQATQVSDRWPDAVEFDTFRIEQNQYPVYTKGIEFIIKQGKAE